MGVFVCACGLETHAPDAVFVALPLAVVTRGALGENSWVMRKHVLPVGPGFQVGMVYLPAEHLLACWRAERQIDRALQRWLRQ